MVAHVHLLPTFRSTNQGLGYARFAEFFDCFNLLISHLDCYFSLYGILQNISRTLAEVAECEKVSCAFTCICLN